MGRKGKKKVNADSIRHESLVFAQDPAQAQFFDLDWTESKNYVDGSTLKARLWAAIPALGS